MAYVKKTTSFDAFISYRRVGGYETAQAVKMALEKKGFRVYLDVDTLRGGGPFNTQLLQAIENAPNFIVILNENSLERCYNKDDWVYQEIEHAFKTKRNIIPVMLTNFQWPQKSPELSADNMVSPDQKDKINENIKNLSLQNGISPSPNSFNDSMNRLGKMLVRPWKNYFAAIKVKVFLAILLTAILLIGGIAIQKKKQYNEFAQASESVSELMALQIQEMDILANRCQQIRKEWDDFIAKLRADNKKGEEYAQEFIQHIKHHLDYLEKEITPKEIIPPSKELLEVLQKNAIDMADIEVFYTTVCPTYRKDIYNCFKSMNNYSQQLVKTPSLIDMYNRTAQNHLELVILLAKGNYIGYLSLLTTMPKSIYPQVRELLVDTTIGDGIPMEQSLDDLTLQLKQNYEKIKRLHDDSNGIIDKYGYSIYSLKTLKEKIDPQKQQELDNRQKEVDAARQKFSDTYKKMLDKFSLSDSDTIGTMWGKMLYITSILRSNITQDLAFEAEGFSKDNISPDDISTKAILADVEKYLDEIKKRLTSDPNIDKSVESAKRYYRLLVDGKVNDIGILVYMIKDNAEHPYLKPGDILLSINGHNISCTEDLFKYANEDTAKGNLFQRLRFSNEGEPEITEYTSVPNSPQVGYFELRITQEIGNANTQNKSQP